MHRLARLTTLIESFHLTKRVVAALVAAMAAMTGALVVLAVTTEDVTQHNGLSTADPSHLRFFIDHRGEALVKAAKLVTVLGAAPTLAVFAVVGAGLLWWRGSRLVVAVAPGVALGTAAVAASAAKAGVGRARPPIAVRLISETEPSFPSGHATDSAAFYLALALVVAVFVLRRPIARVAIIAAASAMTAAIGASRLVLGVHWPTDVFAGWALGLTAAIAVVLIAAAIARLAPPDTAASATARARLLGVLHAQRSIGFRAA